MADASVENMRTQDESLGKEAPRRLRRAASRVEGAFSRSAVTPKGARAYKQAMLLALDTEPSVALRLFDTYDARIPHDLYASAFGDAELPALHALASRDDRVTRTVVFELATRMGCRPLQHEARDGLADLLGGEGDADRLVHWLKRWQDAGLLTPDTLVRALTGHLARASLERDAHVWSGYFHELPERLLPEMFEVRCFLGHGTAAIALADTPARRRRALDCCAASPRLADVRAGLELARAETDGAAERRLHGRVAELFFASGRYGDALPHFRDAGLLVRESACLERLDRFPEALAACPDDRPDDLARLALLCRPGIDGRVADRDFAEAARHVRQAVERLACATPETAEVTQAREELTGLRDAVRMAGREHFARRAERAEPGERPAVLRDWSGFEEGTGDPGAAARRAEEGGDRYRAHRLYREAARFGDAERVLQDEGTEEGRIARAEARADGGDLVGAARLYAETGRTDEAVELFLRGGDTAAAARYLLDRLGDDAIEDPRFAECLRRSGDRDELARHCLRAIDRRGRDTRAVGELRALYRDAALPPLVAARVATALEALDRQGRRPFEERCVAWIARARADVDRRFAGIWGLDLGTTTCAAAIYDTELGRTVPCPWQGHDQFASTLSLDTEGNELVGLHGVEIFAARLVGHVGSAKRKMGTRSVFRIRDRTYRPEEVAARLIHHARVRVEDLLAAHVADRVAELARAELGEIRDEWLLWLADNHDLRVTRRRAILTIPAYFLNNQKNATRHACEIAGVQPVRLIHEPTAACLSAARERRLTGRTVVVDLGAGTLDVSLLDVADNVYDVRQVSGDTAYGGDDFDTVIGQALVRRLEQRGTPVPRTGTARRRLDVAAEYLKIVLSSQEHADYSLLSFADDRDVRLELDTTELARLLAEPLRTLREACTRFRTSLGAQPEHLVLVGGPMLSPLVREVIEDAFGLRRTTLPDPRSAVARGAALQAAALDGRIEDVLLLDVTPLALGIRVREDAGSEEFSELIGANTRIPVAEHKTYTTTEDGQTEVRIEIFNAGLTPRAKIGQFRLAGIPPAPKGVPEIEVTFSIDASCVLDVTARDTGTGRSNSVRISDTTLLPPGEREAMARRREEQVDTQKLRRRLRELADEAEGADTRTPWREFQDRLAAHRPASAPPDAATQRTLTEIFNDSAALEADLTAARGPLGDLTAKARAYLGRAGAEQDPSEGRHLARELRDHLDRLAPQLARLTRWNTVLDAVAGAETDPLLRFRNLHDTGAYARALAWLDEETVPLRWAEDVGRRLHCLAEVGDTAGYRDVLFAGADLLRVPLLDPDRPEPFWAHARSALVRVGVLGARHRDDGDRAGPAGPAGGGDGPPGTGFLISDRLVVTNRHWLVEPGEGRAVVDPGRITVGLETGTVPVRRIHHPPAAYTDLLVLRLNRPVDAPALRLGHGVLVRIGDQVWAVGNVPGTAEPTGPRPGLVDGFESFPEQDLRLYRTGLRLAPPCSGGPLLNAFGEVIGVLALGGGAGGGAFALSVDALAPLLASAGFGAPGEA